jgi:hypothetical protein
MEASPARARGAARIAVERSEEASCESCGGSSILAAGSAIGCAAPGTARRPRVALQVRSVRDEDTGLETSEWRVEARTPGRAGRAWLAGPAGAPVALARERGAFRAEGRAAGPAAWLERGLLLVQAGADDEPGEPGDGAAVDDAVLEREDDRAEDLASADPADLVSTQVELPSPPPRPALEGLRAGPEGQGVRWRVALGGPPAWFDLLVSDALTGCPVFRSLGAGRPAEDGASLEEPLPAGLLRPDRSYVVEVRARSERGLVAVERASRRTLRLP